MVPRSSCCGINLALLLCGLWLYPALAAAGNNIRPPVASTRCRASTTFSPNETSHRPDSSLKATSCTQVFVWTYGRTPNSSAARTAYASSSSRGYA